MARISALRDDILNSLAARPASNDPLDGLTREDLAKQLGYAPGSLSHVLRELETLGEVTSSRARVPGAPYRRLLFRLSEQARLHISRSAIPLPKNLPEPAEPFVGRVRELEQIYKVYKTGGVAVVDGVPGVGKSALVRRSLRFVWGHRILIWLTLRGSSPATVQARLEEEMGPLLLPATKGKAAAAVEASLSQLLARCPVGVVWVFDELQEAPPETQLFIREGLSAIGTHSPHTAVLITQRELPWPVPSEVCHLSIRGLPRKEALALTDALGLPDDRFEELYRGTLGNPRFLRQGVDSPSRETELFADTVLSSLSEIERGALLLLSLSWERAPAAWALRVGLSERGLQSLLRRSVLDRTENGLRVPEPLAERLRQTASWEVLRKAHQQLAHVSGPMAPGERLVHLVEAEEVAEAARWLSKERVAVLESSAERLLPTALRLANLQKPGLQRGRALAAAAEIVRRGGDFVGASSLLQRALEDLPSGDEEAYLCATYLVLSSLRAGHLHDARAWARRLAPTSGHASGAPFHLVASGAILAHEGRWKKALTLFERSRAQARDQGLEELQVLALHSMTYIYEIQGRHEDLLQAYQEASKLSKRIGNSYLALALEIEAALALLLTGRLAEAEEKYEGILAQAKRNGVKVSMAVASMGIASVAFRKGDLRRAVAFGREALQIAESASDRALVSRALSTLSEVLHKLGDVDGSVHSAQRAIDLAREGGRQSDIKLALDALSLNLESSSLHRVPEAAKLGAKRE